MPSLPVPLSGVSTDSSEFVLRQRRCGVQQGAGVPSYGRPHIPGVMSPARA
jgi:hypothetical protein